MHEFYGDRFGKLATYLCGCEDAWRIVKNREGWKDFYRLWERLSNYRDNNGKVPEPPWRRSPGSGGPQVQSAALSSNPGT